MKCTLEELIYTFPTKHEYGFIKEEIDELLYEFNIKREDYNKKHGINTCMLIEGEIISYKTDVYTTILCCLQKRAKNLAEWD